MDVDKFEERAAIMEFCGGMSRFSAETEAAREQGMSRWEAIGDVARRVVAQARNSSEAMDRGARKDNVPGMQPGEEEKARPMSERFRD